jgi:ribosomal protein S18 acetylase RimI-like enzyme
MANGFDFNKHVKAYMDIHYIEGANGYVVWRMGTGGNTELLHLHASPTRKSHGKTLLKRMLEELLKDPPYCTVYGYCLESNTDAQRFYTSMGFHLTHVTGIYKEGGAYVFSQTYERLKEIHGVQFREATAARA